MDEISEHIIEQCRAGNTAAFAEIVRRYERPLFGYIYRLGCIPPAREPEDVVQEILVKVYQSIQQYQSRDDCTFSTWLFSIARNHCLSLMRRMKLELRVLRPLEKTDVSEFFGHESGPAEEVSRKEIKAQVAAAVAALPEAMRSAFILRYYEDMPYEGIARVLDCNVGTVRSRLARARKAIQEFFEETGEKRRQEG